MPSGYWEVDVPRSASTCGMCCEGIQVGNVRFQWFQGGIRDANQKSFFHMECAVSAGADGKHFHKVGRNTVRRALGLTKAQHSLLEAIYANSGIPPQANALGTGKRKRGQAEQGDAATVVVPSSQHAVGAAASAASVLPLPKEQCKRIRLDIIGEDVLRVCSSHGGGGSSSSSNATAEIIGTWPELKREGRAASSSGCISHDGCSGSTWSTAMKNGPMVLRRLTGSAYDDPPKWVVEAWGSAGKLMEGNGRSKSASAVRYSRLMPGAVRKSFGRLRPYQSEAVRFGIARGGRMLCGDEMGLGKTLTALALAFEYQEEWPVLVVCPAMLRQQWEAEILQWLGHVVKESEVQVIVHGADKLSRKAKFVIVPYSFITRGEFQQTSSRKAYKVVICDESHYIKELAAHRTQACVPLLSAARRAVLLSGTLAVNNPVELYPQLVAILGSSMKSFKDFAQRYSNKKVFKVGWRRIEKWVGVRRELELGVLLRSVMLRRKLDEVMTELPAKRRQRIVLSATADVPQVGQGSTLENLQLSVGPLPDAFRHLCAAKVRSTQEYLDHFLESLSAKTLLYAHHHGMLDALQRTLHKSKIKFVRIDGKTPMGRRMSHIRSFQKDPSVRCALLSITACSTGVDLSVARHVVFCELYWVPGVMDQCEARAHRHGQTSMVDVQYLVVKGSIDEAAFRSLSSKKITTSTVLDGQKSTLQAPEEFAGVRKRPAAF